MIFGLTATSLITVTIPEGIIRHLKPAERTALTARMYAAGAEQVGGKKHAMRVTLRGTSEQDCMMLVARELQEYFDDISMVLSDAQGRIMHAMLKKPVGEVVVVCENRASDAPPHDVQGAFGTLCVLAERGFIRFEPGVGVFNCVLIRTPSAREMRTTVRTG